MSNMTSKTFPNFLKKFEACNFQWLLTQQRIERLRALLTEGLEEHRSWGHPANSRSVLYLSWSRNSKVVSVSQRNVLTTGYRATQRASQDYDIYGYFIRQNALWFTVFPYLCTRKKPSESRRHPNPYNLVKNMFIDKLRDKQPSMNERFLCLLSMLTYCTVREGAGSGK